MPNDFSVDGKEVLIRIIKYLVEGLVVAIAAWLLPNKKLDVTEIITIAVISAATFSTLDLFAPSIGNASRSGAGWAIGANLAGLNVGAPAGLFK